MIPAAALLIGDLYLLGLLVYRQEYLVLQILLLTQLWLAAILVPFRVRGETKIEKTRPIWTGLLVAALLVAAATGLSYSLEDYWSQSSNLKASLALLLGEYGELLAVFAAIVMGATLGAASFLRGGAR